jgi:predicted nucleic acid-binding protein
MKGRFLIDSNILVYAYDRSEPEKQERALEVLDRLATLRQGVLTSQVMAEFFVVTTQRLSKPLTMEEAYERVKTYLRLWPIIDITGLVILEAIRGVKEHGFSYWDSQIWASARLNQIPVILSEDFATDSVIEGIRFLNPFLSSFTLAV